MTTKEPLSLPRHALPWVLLSQSYVLMQLVGHIPYWIYALFVLAVGWRSLTHMGRLSYPNSYIKAVVVVATSAAIIATSRFDLESATAFLVAAGILKLLEMRHLKDLYVVVFLNFFIQGIVFLFEQSIGYFLIALIGVWLLISTLVLAHYSDSQKGRYKRTTKMAAQLMLLSLPMMLVLYFLFPRIGPLWGLTLQSNKALTGLSDQMNPADIAELSQSAELAFRVTFDKQGIPARQELYWRALVLDHYTGRQWRAQHTPQLQWPMNDQEPTPEQRSYEIIQEATGQNWLFSMAPAATLERGIGINEQGLLRTRRPVFQRKRYQVAQDLTEALPAKQLSDFERRTYLQLPKGYNPKAQALAQELQQQSATELELLDKLMQYFYQQEFSYTLKPQILGKNEIDDFLFNTKAGFCAHYAGALTFMARSVGIPARVVAGYQGGEWNETEQYLTVRQYDAHAWVEIWQPEFGWLRYDPTAMVAADRIEFGLEQALAEEGSFMEGQLFSMQKYKSVAWLNKLRISLDTINYQWQRWVLSYDNQRQKGFLEKVLGFNHWQQSLYIIAASFIVFFLIASVLLWWRLRAAKPSPFIQAWQKLQTRAKKMGVQPKTGETVTQYCNRLIQAYPQHEALIQSTAQQINQWLYQDDSPDDKAMQEAVIESIKHLTKQLSVQKG